MTPRDRRQMRITTPAMRAADLRRIRVRLTTWRVQNVTPAQVELFYDLALGDVELAAHAIRDVAAGRVNTDLRRLRSLEGK